MKNPARRLRLLLATLAIAAAATLAYGTAATTAHAQSGAARPGDLAETTGKTAPRSSNGESAASTLKERGENDSPTTGSTNKSGPDTPPASGSPNGSVFDGAPTSAPGKERGEAPFDTAFPKAAAQKSIRGRAVSPGVAAQLAARMPRYEEPKPEEPAAPAEEPADQRDIDKPQNQILRLPDYVVREKKPAILREADLYQGDARAELAKQRYFSETGLALNRYSLPFFGSGAGGAAAYALLRYEEDERLRHIGELSATARDIGQLDNDSKSEAALRSLIRDTWLRSGTRSDDYNGYRKPD